MATPVTVVTSGGIGVVEVTAGGMAITEAGGFGLPVTKVAATLGGMPVTFVSSTGGAVVPAYTTWDTGTITNVTLSNGNLTATHSNTTSNSGARSIAYKNSGKYYFEITPSWTGADILGIVTTAGTYTNVVSQVDKGAFVGVSGAISVAGSTGSLTLGLITAGTVIGVAVDLDNDKVWFRKAPAGNWDGLAIGSENPATNTGGVNIAVYSSTTVAPVVGFGATTAGNNFIANFGASAFSGAVPSGFTAGWPA